MQSTSYLAGLFDGEGSACIGTNPQGHFSPMTSIQMNDKEPLQSFAQYFGGKIHLKSNGAYVWRLTCRKTIPVVKVLLPLVLLERKREALSCVLKCAENLLTKRPGMPLPSYMRDLRAQLKAKCQQLNATGNKHPLPVEHTTLHIPSIRNQPTASDIEYAAGLFDGEGSAIISQHSNLLLGNVIPAVEIGMCDIEPLVKFAQWFGGLFSLCKGGAGKRSDYYRWRIWGAQIIPFAEILIPHLRIPRKQKALFCVLECARTFSRENNQPLERQILTEREQLREACCKLNSRDVRSQSKFLKQEVEITITPPSQLRLF